MSEDQYIKAIQAVAAKCIRLEARCDALGSFLGVLAMKQGMTEKQVADVLEKATEEFHQRRLTSLEDVDPAGAAGLDLRPPYT